MPKVAQRVDLRIMTGNDAGLYSTYVDDITARALVLVLPMVGNRPVELCDGEPVECEYLYTSQTHVRFESRVVALCGGQIPLVVVAAPASDKMDIIQRRTFVRMDTSVPVLYRVDKNGFSGSDQAPIRSRTRDLSGNGALILGERGLPIGTRLQVRLDLPQQPLDTPAEVVRVLPAPKGAWLGIRLHFRTPQDREIVIRFIFQVERELRRKGLG